MATHFNSIQESAMASKDLKIYPVPLNINDTVPTDDTTAEDTLYSRLQLVKGLLRQAVGSNQYFEIQPVDMRRFTSWPIHNYEDPIRVFENLGKQHAVISDVQLIDTLLDMKYFLINLIHAFTSYNSSRPTDTFGHLNPQSRGHKYTYTRVPSSPVVYVINRVKYVAYPKDEADAMVTTLAWSKSDKAETKLSAKARVHDALRNAGEANA